MTRNWWIKCIVLATVTVLSLGTIFPTISGLDLEKSSFPFKKKVNLGLDLQGGLYMVFGIEFPKAFKEILLRQAESFKSYLKENEQITLGAVDFSKNPDAAEDDPRVKIHVPAESKEKVIAALKGRYTTLRITGNDATGLELGVSREYRAEMKDQTVAQSIQVIRNRIDEFGVAEPSIASQGTDRIVVELPGVSDVERAKALIGRTAKLEFKIVADKEMGPSDLQALISKIEVENKIQFKDGESFSNYVTQLNEAARGKIPAGTEIAFERTESTRNGAGEVSPSERVPYLLFLKTEVSGDALQDAHVSYDQENSRPIVSFELNVQGATHFEEVTGANIGKRLAIVLDGIVHSAPMIQSKIPGGRGQITLGSGNVDKSMQEAKDLAIVLRAGALPAKLDLLEQRVIGPSLGQDSIRSGAISGVIGCAAIFLFMLFYYKGSGLVAVISLILNGIFTLAMLIGLDATLTLPGIAGMALTIGMAVDSNVIIFERIRDELQEGKAIVAAIESGFDKAWSSIFDANITHGIVALILFEFGTGPIRGFAVTLLVGIVTTMFCAVTVCKFFFDTMIAAKKNQVTSLSI